jgi:NADH:ubiquinone oxidoreductase subunit 3 (subunit A)
MLDLEFLIAITMIAQPPFFGFVLFLLSRRGVVSKFFFSFLKTTRRRFKSVKFFECAVYSRLTSSIQYDVFILSFCVLFILYDVDLLFFFAEAVNFDQWSYIEFFFVTLNFALLVVGLWYDYIRCGFN